MIASFINALETMPSLLLFCVGVLGLMVGSFLNVVIYRVPIMLKKQWQEECQAYLNDDKMDFTEPTHSEFNLLWPASHCPHCKAQIKAIHNIPVLSYLLLRARSACCRHPISFRYPVIEIISAALSVLLAHHFGASFALLAALVLTWTLVALTFIDLDHYLLPDNMTLPVLWLGLLANINGIFVSLSEAVIGAVAGYLSLWLVTWVFKLITGKIGMGNGDFKLLALLGAWMGWQVLPVIIFLSALVGAMVGITLIIFKKQNRSTPIPFGPYLAGAGIITLIWGEPIMQYYLQILQ